MDENPTSRGREMSTIVYIDWRAPIIFPQLTRIDRAFVSLVRKITTRASRPCHSAGFPLAACEFAVGRGFVFAVLMFRTWRGRLAHVFLSFFLDLDFTIQKR